MGKPVSRFPMHHQSCKCKTNLTSEMLALENKYRKTHELWLVATTLLKICFEAKRLTFPEHHKPVTAKKICVWQQSNRHFSSGDNTRTRWRMPERGHTIKQSVTVHENSRMAEPSNVHWKHAMKLIF